MRRAIWQDDESTSYCTKCKVEFKYPTVLKHHCRRCGLIYCADCTSSKLLVPADELVPRPPNWIQTKLPNDFNLDEDNFRIPQRVCDQCSHIVRNLQGELRTSVAKYNQETYIDYNPSIPALPAVNFKLENELMKATVMLHNFRHTNGEEKIPRELLEIAQGVVFLTVLKAGFMFTGRYGTGLVVAKLPDGTWSAPSAVMLSGVGWGLQIGAEVTDVMLILSSESAVETFKSRAQISVGAELGVSVGPIGRAIGSDVTAGNKGAAHAFSYAHSKGLFFGASLEASGIASRPDVNTAFYGEKVSVSSLLSGEYPKPKAAEPMYRTLNEVMNESRIPISSQSYTATRDYSAGSPNRTYTNVTKPVSVPQPQELNEDEGHYL